MTITVVFSVTEQDILEGNARTCDFCPAALALLREARLRFPERAPFLRVSVRRSDVVVDDARISEKDWKWICRRPPEGLVSFIEAVDAGRDVHPDTFMLTFTEVY